MENQTTNTEVKSNFISFYRNNNIEIPLIQRDYVQGSNLQAEKRDAFIDSLYAALIDETTNCDLDFIYGTFKNGFFFPLDGQQRLTTLYLLHWYLLNKCRIEDAESYANITKGINFDERQFTYKTRRSSTAFCQKLIAFHPKSLPETISKKIKEQNWFSEDWQQDPSIIAMLDMLDALNNKFKKLTAPSIAKMLERLLNTQAISFDKLDMGAYKLTDSLYIKMNARGKQLTAFENFKANLIKRIEEQKWKESDCITDHFSHKMDTIYTDLFWEYRGEVNVIDYEVTNFFAGMAMIGYALKENSEAQQKRIQELFNNPLSVRVEDFEKSDFERFTSYLDLYSEVEKISIETELWKYYNSDNKRGFFEEFIKDENKGTGEFYKGATYPQRVFFYALSELFMKSEDKNNISEDFIRVIRNIVENATIDSAQTFVGAIKLMKELLEGFLEVLSKGVQDIYSYLSKTAIQSNFASYQVTQEKQKAERIVANLEWKDVIWEAENHPMFKGDIGFLLLETENNLSLFKKRYEVAKEMFDEKGVKGKYKENMLLIRALVATFDEWHLLTHGLTYDCEKDTWKEILEYDRDSSAYFLKVLDSPIPLEELVKQPSKMKGYEEPHQDLYQTNLLEAIQQRRPNNRGFTYHSSWGVHILYPPYYSGYYYGCIIGEERNKKLAQAVDKDIIKTEQQLEVNSKKIPFFWGWDVHFIYKDKEYVWRYDGKITQGEQNCTEEILKIFE